MKKLLYILPIVILIVSCDKRKDMLASQPDNKAPIADAGADISIKLPQDSAYLDGRLSIDPDGIVASYKWMYVDGPSSFVIEKPTAALTVVGKLVPGIYHFQLTVTDNAGASSNAIKKVQVKDLVSPGTAYKLDTTIVYTDNTVIKDTSWLAPFLTEWGSYRSFNLPAIAGAVTSNIQVFRKIEPTNAPWAKLSFVPEVYPNMAVPLYGGVYTLNGTTITTGIGIIGSPSVRVYVRVTIK